MDAPAQVVKPSTRTRSVSRGRAAILTPHVEESSVTSVTARSRLVLACLVAAVIAGCAPPSSAKIPPAGTGAAAVTAPTATPIVVWSMSTLTPFPETNIRELATPSVGADGVVIGAAGERYNSGAPTVEPWRRVMLDEDAGRWVVAGDLDGDGVIEIVSARNVDENDVHYTSGVVAQRLDGTVMWRWYAPRMGRANLHHDVACQIHDWDGDGLNDVSIATDGAVLELDGRSGEVRRRLPIESGASDCLVFADLSGVGRPTDVLVKTRYTDIWAYSYDWELLWQVHMPGGYRTAHQPRPYDLDGDGRDEVFAGFAMLNSDGSVRWVYDSALPGQSQGHLDAVRAVVRGDEPAEWRFVITGCGANRVAYLDGLGNVLWERSGYHFESVSVGDVCPDVPGAEILVDVCHYDRCEAPLWILDGEGNVLGEWMTTYSRPQGVLDWTGDGVDEIVLADARGIFDWRGNRLAILSAHLPNGLPQESGGHLTLGDMTGDGVADIMISTAEAVYIYENAGLGAAPANGLPTGAPLGSEFNRSLY